MTERRWVPHRYVDEISPPAREVPSDWIIRLPGDAYAVAPADDAGDETATPWFLKDGDTVEFDWIEDHGTATFTVAADGSWTVDRQPPAGTTCFCEIGNVDSLGCSLEDFARNWIEADPSPDETTIAYYTWSDAPVEFTFVGGSMIEAGHG